MSYYKGRWTDEDAAYRVNYFYQGKQHFMGPYDKAGTAKAQLTLMKKYYGRHPDFEGWVEQATGWERI